MQVIHSLHRRHQATEFKKFLVTIDKTVPAELDIHLIVVNYGTHTPGDPHMADQTSSLHLHFTATGSSWINHVERRFGFLTDQMIRRGAHKNVQTLEADIRAWIKN